MVNTGTTVMCAPLSVSRAAGGVGGSQSGGCRATELRAMMYGGGTTTKRLIMQYIYILM